MTGRLGETVEERLTSGDFHHQVKMIAHQTKGMQPDLKVHYRLFQPIPKSSVILSIPKQSFRPPHRPAGRPWGLNPIPDLPFVYRLSGDFGQAVVGFYQVAGDGAGAAVSDGASVDFYDRYHFGSGPG